MLVTLFSQYYCEEPFNVLSQKLECDPIQLEPAIYNEFVNCLEITELLGRRNTSVLEVFSYWRNKCESLLIAPVSHQTAMTTLIRALMLTKGLGYLVSELKPMCKNYCTYKLKSLY